MNIDQLNRLSVTDFVATLAGVYEHSPWIPNHCFAAAPFASIGQLHASMQKIVAEATLEEQLSLLCAHPELAGKEAAAGTLTTHSTDEQTGAGLVNLSDAERAEIVALNRRYREHFGFPFIIAVKHHTRSSIFSEFRRRVANTDVVAERQACLAQVDEIARFRLEALLAD